MALKLAALDEDDLAVISAHVQDAAAKPAEFLYDKAAGTFVLPMRRFVWEKRRSFFSRNERRLSALSASRVRAVRSSGVPRHDEAAVLNLLALRFTGNGVKDDPAGTIELVFSGDATIALDVECIELRLADLGAAWQTDKRPVHRA